MQADDLLVSEEGAIVLVDSRLTLISSLGAEILDFTGDWRTVEEIVERLTFVFGEPRDRSATATTVALLRQLDDAGLVRMSEAAVSLPESPYPETTRSGSGH